VPETGRARRVVSRPSAEGYVAGTVNDALLLADACACVDERLERIALAYLRDVGVHLE
jgi:hypothetical protein